MMSYHFALHIQRVLSSMGTAYRRWLTLQEIHESFMCHYKLTMERIHERSCAARFITGKKTFQPDMRGQRFPEDTAYHQLSFIASAKFILFLSIRYFIMEIVSVQGTKYLSLNILNLFLKHGLLYGFGTIIWMETRRGEYKYLRQPR